MKKILMITTGGTIASASTENGLVPTFNADELLLLIPEGTCRMHSCSPLMVSRVCS